MPPGAEVPAELPPPPCSSPLSSSSSSSSSSPPCVFVSPGRTDAREALVWAAVGGRPPEARVPAKGDLEGSEQACR